MAEQESITEAGAVLAEEVTVTTFQGKQYNIRNFCVETILYEDLFSNVMSGECLLLDSAGLISSIPFQGTEFITLSFRTPTFSERIAKSFYITGVKKRSFSEGGEHEQSYVLTFVSIEGMMDTSVTLSQKFAGTTDTVVRKLFNDHLSTERIVGKPQKTSVSMKFDPHASTVTMVAPMWSPLKVINWTAARSIGAGATKAPNFMFYESNKGFCFFSVEDLIVDQRNGGRVFAEYVYVPAAAAAFPKKQQGNFTYTKPDLAFAYNRVQEIQPFDQMDVLRAQDFGYYDSVLMTHDIVLKQVKEFPYNHYTGHQNFNNMEDFSTKGGAVSSTKWAQTQPFPKMVWQNQTNRRSLRSKHFGLYTNGADPKYENWVSQRNSLLFELSNVRMNIHVPGRTDVEVGKLVNFLFPRGVDAGDNTTPENVYDPYLSGLYLIAAIRHSFYLNKHSMTLELVKDSYRTPLL